MSDFHAFARGCGVLIGRLVADGKIHRCGTVDHPKSKNGAYSFDGRRGWAMAWDAGEEVSWFGGDAEWTEADKAEWKARQDSARAYQARLHQQAANKARELLDGCALMRHGYLRLKGFPDERGLVTTDETLVIPMRIDRTNTLLGAQTIRWDAEERKWVKKMLYGMRAKGAIYRMGRYGQETVLCEGYATGLSLMAAIRMLRVDISVLVCFSAQNMKHVAAQTPGRVLIAADNDASGTGERIARETGRPWAMPPTVGHDFNDWHQAEGLVPVCRSLMELRREAVPSTA